METVPLVSFSLFINTIKPSFKITVTLGRFGKLASTRYKDFILVISVSLFNAKAKVNNGFLIGFDVNSSVTLISELPERIV